MTPFTQASVTGKSTETERRLRAAKGGRASREWLLDNGDFPSSPVVKTPPFYCGAHRFDS